MEKPAKVNIEPVRIVAYEDSWPDRFDAEKALLERAIGRWVTGGIHHVGSTAVPGLAAKPLIDILVGVEDLPSSRTCFGELVKLSYGLRAAFLADESLCGLHSRHAAIS